MELDRIARMAGDSARRARRTLLVGGALALLAVTALGFATAALYLSVSELAGPPLACLVIAAGYGLAALGVWLALLDHGEARQSRSSSVSPGLERDAVSELIATFLAGVRAGREGFGRDDR